jgi:hypothetical protein
MQDCTDEELIADDQYEDDEFDDGALDGDVTGCEDWDDEFDDTDSPTDFDEYEANADDCFEDPCDQFDCEYDC